MFDDSNIIGTIKGHRGIAAAAADEKPRYLPDKNDDSENSRCKPGFNQLTQEI